MPPWGATRRRYGTGCALPAAVAGAYESSGRIRVVRVEAYAYLDDVTVAADDISPGTVEVVPFLERELTARDVHLNPGKRVALVPKGHVPTPEEMSLLAGVGVRIADETGIKVIGVPVGSDEFEIKSAIGIAGDGGAQQFARMLPRMPDK